MAEKFRSLREIVATASPELKQKVAGRVLVDGMRGNRISSIGSLYAATLSHYAETSNPAERRDAERILRDLKLRMRLRPPSSLDPFIYEVSGSLSDKAKAQVAELAMVASLAKEGGLALLEATAVLLASKSVNSTDRRNAIFLLKLFGPEDSIEMFKFLRALNFVTMDDVDLFLEIKNEAAKELLEEAAEKEVQDAQKPAAGTPSEVPPLAEEEDEVLLELAQMNISDEELSSLDDFKGYRNEFSQDLYSALLAKGLLELLKFPEEEIAKEENEPVELSSDLDSVGLRDASLRGKTIPDFIMYRLICVKCFGFGLGSSSAFVASSSASASKLQSNLLRKIRGDKKLKRQMLKCWKSMEQAGAINTSDSSRASGKSASLNLKSSEIINPEIKEAIEWVVAQNRRLQ